MEAAETTPPRARPISRGGIRFYWIGCPCGRAWEFDTPPDSIPGHEHNQEGRR